MRTFAYRLVNVFAESIFGGNPLCVFEDGRGLRDDEMHALALQFNLSETTFLLPSDKATSRVRIFTPTIEMAFAGHPTLGSAHVVRDLQNVGDAVTLEMKAGVIPVRAESDRWTLQVAAPTSRDCTQSRDALAATLGLDVADILDGACWLNTGTEQLIVPLATTDAVKRAKPNAAALASLKSEIDRSMAYIFAPSNAPNGEGKLLSRFFFLKHSAVLEDPGTGSATANLGAWLIHNGKSPCTYAIEQGAQTGRPCHIGLTADANGNIFVSGRVAEIGRGVITLPD